MGFNSISLGGKSNSYFGLKTGLNSISFEGVKDSYFGLKTGLNSVSLGANISIGRLFLASNLFTSATTITITSIQGSYQVVTETGYFPVYPFWSDPTTVLQITIEADAGSYVGEVTVTPSIPQYIDIDLELVSGMCDKITSIVVIPAIDSSAIPSETADLPFNLCECCVSEIAFTDEIGTDQRKNDKSSFLFRKYGLSDTVDFELWKAGVKVADIVDSSYGNYYGFGDFVTQPDYKGLVLDWYLVQQSFGYGNYTLKAVQSLLGVASTVESRIFQLMPYSDFAANETVKIEAYQTGHILSSSFDYTDLVEGGWYSSFRISGFFGLKTPSFESDNYITSDYVKSQIQDKLITEYTLETRLIPSVIANALVYDSILANAILITDYNVNNSEVFNQISVYPITPEVKHLANNKNLIYTIKFQEKTQNNIKRNF